MVVVFLAAALEYMVPPLPADSVLLASSLLVIAHAWSLPTVLAVAVAGGFVGSTLHYAIGRALAVEGGGMRGQRVVEKLTGKGSIERFFERFRRYGSWLILFNRMFPGIRGATFLAAGAARLPPVKTLLLGLLSNIAWTLTILLLGVTVGGSWEKIEATFRVYSRTLGLVVLGVGGGIWLVRALLRRRRRAEGGTPSP